MSAGANTAMAAANTPIVKTRYFISMPPYFGPLPVGEYTPEPGLQATIFRQMPALYSGSRQRRLRRGFTRLGARTEPAKASRHEGNSCVARLIPFARSVIILRRDDRASPQSIPDTRPPG